MRMKIIALIPARGGSKSMPRKNLADLGGHPLIAWSIAAARLCDAIEDVVVTTDSTEIAEIAREYGASVPFLRPAELARDHSLDRQFFEHYLAHVRSAGEAAPDLIVHLRPTTPLRDPHEIDNAIRFMTTHRDATSLRSMHRTSLTPYKMFRIRDGVADPFLHKPGLREPYNSPRQWFEDAFIPNGYVDIVRPAVLAESGLLHGKRMKVHETDPVPDIDGPDDLARAARANSQPRFALLVDWLEAHRCARA
jgi:N-acylneuraminate cytidylyltransferase